MLKMPSVQRSFSLLPPGLFAFFLYFWIYGKIRLRKCCIFCFCIFWIFNRFFRISIPFCNHLMKNLHKFFSGDRLFLDQVSCDFIHRIAVSCQKFFCLLIRLFQDLHDLVVDFGCCGIAAV